MKVGHTHTAADGPDDGEQLARGDVERHALQDGVALAPRTRHVGKHHRGARVGSERGGEGGVGVLEESEKTLEENAQLGPGLNGPWGQGGRSGWLQAQEK